MILSNEKVSQNQVACVKFTAKDFKNIGSFQFDITYDPAILKFKNISNINPSLSGFSQNNSTNLVKAGDLAILYSIALGINIPDNAVLFEICFDAIGANGTVSPVQIVAPLSQPPQPLEVGDAAGNPLGFSIIQGSVKIGNIVVDLILTPIV